MKKALKISTYCLIVSCIIALALCYIIIPERTKWAIDIVVQYLNTPIGIGAGTSITLGAVVFFIVKYAISTNVGKKIKDFNSTIAEKEQLLKQDKVKLELQKEEIETYIKSYKEQIDTYYETLLKVCETIPNAKVKAIASELKGTKETLDTKVSEQLANVKEFSDKQEKTLEERLAELEKVVNSYGEREERVND